jgi:hypothetical protein
MNEKFVAGIVTAAGIGPICAVCVLGPAAVGSALAGAFGWLEGAGPLLTVAMMVGAGLLVYRTMRRKDKSIGTSGDDQPVARFANVESSKLAASGIGSGVRTAEHGERS